MGQHGHKYGTHYYANETIEELTCDKFITWGWAKNSKIYAPAFILTQAHKILKQTPNGGLLLVQTVIDHRYRTWDVAHEYAEYFEQQIEFVNNLSENLQKELTVRLHSTHGLTSTNTKERWGRPSSKYKN